MPPAPLSPSADGDPTSPESWGARTVSSNPERQYINVSRHFPYLERSIERGTQWVAFEPNDASISHRVSYAVEAFLFNEFRASARPGDKPDKANFVRCDHSTITKNDIDNGRLICRNGVAPLKPAEFVIFRIGQKTANGKC